MSYQNYDVDIIQRHKVKIMGWPSSIPFMSPSSLNSMQNVRDLIDEFEAGSCRWVFVPADELKRHNQMLKEKEAAGQPAKRPRVRRKDAGLSRGPQKKKGKGKRGAADGGGDGEGNGAAAQTQRKRKATGSGEGSAVVAEKKRRIASSGRSKQLPPGPRSSEFVDSDDDDSDDDDDDDSGSGGDDGPGSTSGLPE